MYNKLSVFVSSVTSYIILSHLIIGLTCTPVLADPIYFVGSDTVGNELLPKLLEAYNAHAASKIEYHITNPQGTKNGWCAYEQQQIDAPINVVMASSTVTDADLSLCNGHLKADELHTLEIEHLIGLDGVVIIVHKNNPVPIITMNELKDIFCSDIPLLSWKNFGWVDKPIEVVALDEGSGTTATIRQVVCEGKRLPAAATSSFNHHDKIIQHIAAHDYAIGFTSLGALDKSNYIKNIKIKDCGRVYESDRSAVKTEDYPLSRRLFLYTPKPDINETLKPFFDFVQGEKGQQTVNDTKYLNLSIEEVDSNSSSDSARNNIIQEGSYIAEHEIKTFQEATKSAKRLSIVFRFKEKTAKLDIRGETDILRLKEYIRKLKRGNVLLLLGFADSAGGYLASLDIAKERADVVYRKLIDIAEKQGVRIEISSIGPELPVSCNRREVDRERNRRVEVWLKH